MFSTRYHYHNWELFQHEEKPTYSLPGLRFVGWSTHEMWASRALVTVVVTALANCPGQRAVLCLGSAGFPSHRLLRIAERAVKDLHLCLCTYIPFCVVAFA